MSLQDIETIIVVMLENRSFDHMLGYLSLATANPPMRVDGLRDDPGWKQNVGNDFGGKNNEIVRLDPKYSFVDPPHTSIAISQQIETPPHLRSLNNMGGFVASYANPNYYKPSDPKPGVNDLPLAMGYYTRESVSLFDFFARNFAVCDNWFSSLPTSTQPNKLMAMSGESSISENGTLIPNQDLVYDWLNRTPNPRSITSTVPWCSYQWLGLPFFTLMPHWLGRITSQLNDCNNLNYFRHYHDFCGNGETFAAHWRRGSPTIPNVVFIEPKYTSDPTNKKTELPNDDHPPTGISAGQDFLADIYNTLISNTELWAKTMMIVTYDEHGGFFDHVPPLKIPAVAGDQFFRTTGVRVPAFVISPHVEPGTVFHGPLDHTSILQLLADRFEPHQTYSKAVTDRQSHLVRLSTILPLHPPAKIRAPRIPKSVVAAMKKARAATPKKAKPASHDETTEAFLRIVPSIAARYPRLLGK